jgi:hypothetical protein
MVRRGQCERIKNRLEKFRAVPKREVGEAGILHFYWGNCIRDRGVARLIGLMNCSGSRQTAAEQVPHILRLSKASPVEVRDGMSWGPLQRPV